MDPIKSHESIKVENHLSPWSEKEKAGRWKEEAKSQGI